MFKLEEKHRETLSIIKDPFSKSMVTDVRINMSDLNSTSTIFKPSFIAYIEFKNGNTTGKQRIEGKDPDNLFTQLKAFLDTLK